MATPAIRLLRRAFPAAEIDVLVRPGVSAVLRDNPDITRVIAADDRSLPKAVFANLRAKRYEAMMLLPNSLGSAWLSWKLRIPVRVGYSRGGRWPLLTHRVGYDPYAWQTPTEQPLSKKSIRPNAERQNVKDHLPGDRPHHMVDYYMCLAMWTAEALGYKPETGMQFEPGMVVELAPDAVAKVETLLQEHDLAGKRLVGINPGAAYGGAKRWPLERLAQTADELAARYGAAIVSTASRGESKLTDEVAAHAQAKIHRLGEELDLRGLAALIDRFSMLVTNDSGAMHIAAARGVATIAVFGPTDWNVTKPYSSNGVVVRESPPCAPCFLRECPIDHRCMIDVQVQDVMAAAEKLVAGNAGQQKRPLA
jgi:heptosyltransferase II